MRSDQFTGGTAAAAASRGSADLTRSEERDPLDGDVRLADLFGAAWEQVRAFHDLLADQGVVRGLVGPREVNRLWERHLVNSAAVVPFLPATGQIVDVGSGAGLPGVVIAAMRPSAQVVLLEPMARRTEWLMEVVDRLDLTNVEVVRSRAEDQIGQLHADAVTARAVAALAKLYPWTMPLLRVGGQLVALKGGRAAEEVAAGQDVLAVHGGGVPRITVASTLPGVEPTTVVVVGKESEGRGPQRAVPRETAAGRRARSGSKKGSRR